MNSDYSIVTTIGFVIYIYILLIMKIINTIVNAIAILSSATTYYSYAN